MRLLCLVFGSLFIALNSYADCVSYGDARGSNNEGVLCEFGGTNEQFPGDTQYNAQPNNYVRQKHQEGMLNPMEEWNVIRNLTTRYRGDGSLRGSIVGGTNPNSYLGRRAPLIR